ncbi:MAG: hypothetical protein ACR2PT_19865 [Endozoicomonas sp.]
MSDFIQSKPGRVHAHFLQLVDGFFFDKLRGVLATVFSTTAFCSPDIDFTPQDWELFIQPQLFEQVSLSQPCTISLSEQSDMDTIQLEPGCTLTAEHGTSILFTPPLNLSKITLIISTDSISPREETSGSDTWQQAFSSTGKFTRVRPALIFTAKAAPKKSPLIIADDQTETPSLGLELPPGTDPTRAGILRHTEKVTPGLLQEVYFRHYSESRMLPVSIASGGSGDDPDFWWRLKCWLKSTFSCRPRTISFGDDELGDAKLPDDFFRLPIVSDSSSVITIYDPLQPIAPASVADTGYGSDGNEEEDDPDANDDVFND